MSSFDDYFNENFEDGLSSPSKYMLRHTFEAGSQSRQAEIDCLKVQLVGANERAIMLLNHKNTMVDKKDREIALLQEQVDELKKRIDKVVFILDKGTYNIGSDTLVNILEGNQS